MTQPPSPPTQLSPLSAAAIDAALQPWAADCRYLRSAATTRDDKGNFWAHAVFAIDAPCDIDDTGIDDTGHFNSVEFNLCVEQLAHVLVAAEATTARVRPPSLGSLTRVESNFVQPLNPRGFEATLVLTPNAAPPERGDPGTRPLQSEETSEAPAGPTWGQVWFGNQLSTACTGHLEWSRSPA